MGSEKKYFNNHSKLTKFFQSSYLLQDGFLKWSASGGRFGDWGSHMVWHGVFPHITGVKYNFFFFKTFRTLTGNPTCTLFTLKLPLVNLGSPKRQRRTVSLKSAKTCCAVRSSKWRSCDFTKKPLFQTISP